MTDFLRDRQALVCGREGGKPICTSGGAAWKGDGDHTEGMGPCVHWALRGSQLVQVLGGALTCVPGYRWPSDRQGYRRGIGGEGWGCQSALAEV